MMPAYITQFTERFILLLSPILCAAVLCMPGTQLSELFALISLPMSFLLSLFAVIKSLTIKNTKASFVAIITLLLPIYLFFFTSIFFDYYFGGDHHIDSLQTILFILFCTCHYYIMSIFCSQYHLKYSFFSCLFGVFFLIGSAFESFGPVYAAWIRDFLSN